MPVEDKRISSGEGANHLHADRADTSRLRARRRRLLPLGEGARAQGCIEGELRDLVLTGRLEINERGHVRPAIVSVIAVRRVDA